MYRKIKCFYIISTDRNIYYYAGIYEVSDLLWDGDLPI